MILTLNGFDITSRAALVTLKKQIWLEVCTPITVAVVRLWTTAAEAEAINDRS